MAISRFPTATVSETDAIDQVEDVAQQAASWADNAAAASTVTLTAAQFVNASYRVTSGTTSAITTPTAAQIVGALKQAQAGSAFDFVLVNGGSGTATVTAGAGVTTVGTISPTTGKNQLYKGIVTNSAPGSEAVTLIALTGLV